MAFALRCPDCRKTFKWNPSAAFPEACPLCLAIMPTDKGGNDGVVMPFIRSARTKATDDTYRQAEAASEVRVQQAAAMAGCDASEMSDLKITDFRSTKREGDIAAPPVVNAVSQHMDAMKAKGLPTGFEAAAGNGAEFSAGINTGAVVVNGHVTQGVAPRAGAAAAERTQKLLHGML